MHYTEWLQCWMICTELNDLHCVTRFVQSWKICKALNDLNYVEWFVKRWVICAALKGLYNAEWFVMRSMIRSAMDDLYNVELFGLSRLMSIPFLMSAECTYSRNYQKIFYTNLCVTFFLIWKYQEEIYSALRQKLVIKRYFDHPGGIY